ncbi:MAG: UDP-2,3-diacylglucosamine diphosphatase [Gammaproteobacteria bacterium]
MNHTLFISDLHLQPSTPEVTEAYFRFLKQQVPGADALYILGDFFEAWIGDDNQTPFNQDIIQSLAQFNLPKYFMRGNRDFLIGDTFAAQTGVTLLPDPCVMQLYGIPVLLMHGDSLCTLDHAHQRFRQWAYNPHYNRYFLKLPLAIRRGIAQFLRWMSQRRTRRIDYSVMDVTPGAVVESMQQMQVKHLIHGHTHKRAIHRFEINEQPMQRIVLGDWHKTGNALKFYDNGSYEFIVF